MVIASPTASPSAPATLVVEKVGAAASPSGFLAFALISNPSDRPAADVRVDVAAVSASGRVLAHGVGVIPRIDAMARQAVAVLLPATTPLPSSFKGTLTANSWLDAAATPGPEHVLDATFVQDPRTPTVRLRVANDASVAERTIVTAVCFDGTGALRGGGRSQVTVAASASGQEIWVPVSVPVVPANCEGFALAG